MKEDQTIDELLKEDQTLEELTFIYLWTEWPLRKNLKPERPSGVTGS
jgi:hypothetical protein